MRCSRGDRPPREGAPGSSRATAPPRRRPRERRRSALPAMRAKAASAAPRAAGVACCSSSSGARSTASRRARHRPTWRASPPQRARDLDRYYDFSAPRRRPARARCRRRSYRAQAAQLGNWADDDPEAKRAIALRLSGGCAARRSPTSSASASRTPRNPKVSKPAFRGPPTATTDGRRWGLVRRGAGTPSCVRCAWNGGVATGAGSSGASFFGQPNRKDDGGFSRSRRPVR